MRLSVGDEWCPRDRTWAVCPCCARWAPARGTFGPRERRRDRRRGACASLVPCGSTSRPRRPPRSASSGSSLSSTVAPATCPTPRSTCSAAATAAARPTPVGSTRSCCATPSRSSPGSARRSGRPPTTCAAPSRSCSPAPTTLGVDLIGAGTHPFASWSEQQLTAGHRYEELINRTQWWGRQMLIWGVHVHVGHAGARPRDPRALLGAQPVPAPPGAVGLVARCGPAPTPATPPTGR